MICYSTFDFILLFVSHTNTCIILRFVTCLTSLIYMSATIYFQTNYPFFYYLILRMIYIWNFLFKSFRINFLYVHGWVINIYVEFLIFAGGRRGESCEWAFGFPKGRRGRKANDYLTLVRLTLIIRFYLLDFSLSILRVLDLI